MSRRLQAVLVVTAALPSLGASHRTQNFQVEAPTPEIACQLGDAAERQRKEIALLWLGRELPPWPEPCPLTVKVTVDAPGGATSFTLRPEGVSSMKMEIRGPLDRLLASVLPREVTHAVLTHSLRRPPPRWADEGAALLAGDRHDHQRFEGQRRALAAGRESSLRRLFAWPDFPPDREEVLALYAQGYSVARFLIERGDRKTFLAFLGRGLADGWDRAAQAAYRYRSVEDLERAWRSWVRDRNHPEAAGTVR